MDNQEKKTQDNLTQVNAKCISDTDFQSIIQAREFFSCTLKNFLLYKKNIDLFGSIYHCCDRCYDLYPKWSQAQFFRNGSEGVTLCKSCHDDALTDDEKKYFELVVNEKRPNTGLYKF